MKHILLLTLCITLITACDSSQTSNQDAAAAESLKRALAHTIDETIVPGFSALKTQSTTLAAKATSFCNTIDEPNLIELQNQWKILSIQWNKMAMYNIGPLDDDLFTPKMNFIESMRLRGTDYTNTVRDELTTQLTSSTVLDAGFFNALLFTKVGMLALEVLIFEDSVSQPTVLSNIVSDYMASGTGDRKCEYLNGMAQLLERTISTVEDGWQKDFLTSGKAFKDTLLNGELEDGTESVPALIIAIQQHFDYLKKRKLEAILDAQIADYFYENISAALDGAETFLEGSNEDSFSFFDRMLAAGFSTEVTIVKNNILTARQAVANKDRSELTAAIGLIDGNFKREIPNSLTVELGINFTDGD